MTVKEIAGLAGVSIGTVDRVIHRRGRVSPATLARVQKIIDQYEFTPNPLAGGLKRNRAYRFAALLPKRNQDAGYWGQAIQGILEGAGEVAPLGVETEICEYDRYNPQEFQILSDAILKKKPDGLIVPPIRPEKIRVFINKIQDLGIPYVFFDADIPDMNPLCRIGQDPVKGGYLAGRLMRLFAGTITKPVGILDAHGEDYHITQRRDGFVRYAREYNFPVIVKEYSDFRGTEISKTEILLFLKENTGIAGLFITNCMIHRASAALKFCAARRELLLVGYDLIPENKRLLKDGLIDAIISQRSAEQGREALRYLYQFVVLKQHVPPKVEIPLDVYIRENVPD
ncbi:MAG: LacI family DNA-binding transcriptional regulator [Treponema sp.]|jgi:LacI family transcriptional regulator|nr:LacI family DNA-binding transcriptional regulator [Treponema sp.]